MYYINTLKQELSTTKTYEHILFGESSVVDTHQSHMTAKFGVLLMRIIARLLHYTGFLNFIKDTISNA